MDEVCLRWASQGRGRGDGDASGFSTRGRSNDANTNRLHNLGHCYLKRCKGGLA